MVNVPILYHKAEAGWFSTLLGLGTIAVIGVAYFLLGDQVLRSEDLYEILDPYGLTIPWKLAIGIVFWIFINSVLEEYVFRWFITSKLEQLVGKNGYQFFFQPASSRSIIRLHWPSSSIRLVMPSHHWAYFLGRHLFMALRPIPKYMGGLGGPCSCRCCGLCNRLASGCRILIICASIEHCHG